MIGKPVLYSLGIIVAAALTTSLSPAQAPDPTCNSSNPCILYTNNGAGPGVRGVSVHGNGLAGTTQNIGTTSSSGRAGLLGNDVSTSGTFNAGVRGISVRGSGVAGQTGTGLVGGSGFVDGVFGSSSGPGNGIGVEGLTGPPTGSGGTAAIQGTNNSTSIAVRANGFGGLLFDGNNKHGVDVLTVDDAGNASIAGNGSINGQSGAIALSAGTASSSLGISGSGFSGIVGTGLGSNSFGVLAVNNGTGGGEALDIQDASGKGVLINAFDSHGTTQFVVDDSGTVHANSFVTPALVRRIQRTSAGPTVTTYAHQSSTPTLEDFGEGRLTAGEAYVTLDHTFASAIDSRANYLVFVTPEGDTRGLYVTQKTPAGFVVRENQGGRSTVAFSYRIVARPYASTETRLAPMPVFQFGPPPHVPRQKAIVFGSHPKLNMTQ